MGFDVKVSRDGDKLTFKVDGRLDSYTSPELAKIVKNEAVDAEQVYYDFADLEYISSAGIRIVAMTVKAIGVDNVRVINANAGVREVFALVGMNSVIA